MTNSLSEDIYVLGELMADNLVTMGVTGADPSDGLTTLAGKILQVPGGGGSGIDLDTAVSLSASSASIITGQSVTLTSDLTVSYDSTVDLEGILIGATVKFKEGNTVVGTGTTDSTGEATVTLSGLSIGSHTLKAVFEGTSDFDACESSTVTVVVTSPEPDHITLTSNKSILSYADSESASLTATVYDSSDNPLSGQTVSMKVYKASDDSLLETLTVADVGDGTYTASYLGKGAGDLYIKAECMSVTKTYAVQDYWWYKPTLDSDFTRTTTGAEHHYTLNNPITLPASFEVKFTTKRASTSRGVVYIILGDDTTHTYSIGAIRNKGSLSVRRDNDNTLIIDNNNNNIIPLAETENTYSYDGTKHTVQSSVTLTGNDANATVGKFLKVVVNTQCSLKGIKIKPL